MKCGDQPFSSSNVPARQEHYYAAANDPYSSSSHSAVILKFPGSLTGKNIEDVAPPIYQTLESGVDAPIYQALNNNRKSSEVWAENTSEGKATHVCRSPNDGVNASIHKHLTIHLSFQTPR